jgi:glycosyltransferase involved in cell wall biosynthesis
MNLIYINSYYEPAFVYGGPVKVESALHKALVNLGVKVTVLTTDANGRQRLDVPLGQPRDLDGVQVMYSAVWNIPPRNFFFSPGLVRACAQQIGSRDLAILGSFWSHATGAAVRACKRSGIPYIIPMHGQLMPWALEQHRLRKYLYLALVGRRYLDGAAALHCATSLEAESLASLQLSTPSFVVPYGVDLEYWSNLPKRGGFRDSLEIPQGALVLLFLGRLHQVKRPGTALQAMAAIGRSDTHLVFVGPDEGGLKAKLCAQSVDTGCAERVHFTGLLTGSGILQAFADADLLIMPSIMESFGLSAVEAMAAGLPILVSEDVPVGACAARSGAGLRVPGTTAAFTVALAEILHEPEQLKAMGKRAKELVEREFDISVVARRMLDQYRSVIDAGSPWSSSSQERCP